MQLRVHQTNGGMFVTGWREWHTGVYCPALKSVGRQLWVHVDKRDEVLIEAMTEPLLGFVDLVNQYEHKLRN